MIKYYGTTTVVANGALIATNALYTQSASVDLRYSTNCGGTTTRTEGDSMYLVGTIGVDGLFYLDATQWRTNELPNTNDGKIYIHIGYALATNGYTSSFLAQRHIYYHNGTKICEYNEEVSEAIYKRPRTGNYTLQSLDGVLTWTAI